MPPPRFPPRPTTTPRRTTSLARQALNDLMTACDVLLDAGGARRGAQKPGDDRSPIFNRAVDADGNAGPSPCQASSIPTAAARVQVVGRFGRDKAALEAARFVEHAITPQSSAPLPKVRDTLRHPRHELRSKRALASI